MESEARMLRETFVDLMIEYAEKDERIVMVEADLSKALGTPRFAEKYPQRFINCGVQEANMISMAAGMSAMGKIPFTHTFTAFASRRVCDQVTVSVAYAGLNVKMIGSDPGITAELNGGTHMSMEDVAIMRNIPNMLIYEPVDSVQLRQAFPQILAHDGPVYIRLLRKNAIGIFDETCRFELGKGTVLREGKDLSIFASGIMLAEALQAGSELEKQGIHAEIINIHTIKPLDTELVLDSCQRTGAAVSAENHSIINGLGAALAEFLSEVRPTPLCRVGVRDHFGEVGKTDFLKKKFGLDAQAIVEAAHKAMSLKQKK